MVSFNIILGWVWLVFELEDELLEDELLVELLVDELLEDELLEDELEVGLSGGEPDIYNNNRK